MGAAQSKKRRKERKKRRRVQSGDFDIPRSASVDVIRSLHVTASSCLHCQTLAGHPSLSVPLGKGTSQQSFLDSVGRERSRRATFLDSFGSLSHTYHHQHRHHHGCGRGHGVDVSDLSDGYESCPSCLPSNNCLASSPSSVLLGDSMRESSRSLTRSALEKSSNTNEELRGSGVLGIRETPVGKEKSAERELALRCQEPVVREYASLQSQFVRRLESCAPPTARTEPTEEVTQHVDGRNHVTQDATYSPTSSSLEAQGACSHDSELRSSQQHISDSNQKPEGKAPVTVLDDETAILARWEKQKFMAQQLRILRKHIQAHESSATTVPPPLPLFNDNEVPDCSSRENVAAEHDRSSDEPQLLTPSPESTGRERRTKPPRKPPRKKFTKMSNYRYLDSHPVLSKLQNEQNNRLESMERRMKEIRTVAMQEAERRKFAEIFPAKEDGSETERMIQEARETLEKLKEEKRVKGKGQQEKQRIQYGASQPKVPFSSAEDCNVEGDSGDIVPVHILHLEENESKSVSEVQNDVQSRKRCRKSEDAAKKSNWVNETWPNINLGHPLTWLWLPFLIFPLILRLILSFVIKSPNNNSRSSNPRRSSSDSAQNKSKQ